MRQLRVFGYLAVALLATSCSSPSGYRLWDKNLHIPLVSDGYSIEEIINNLHQKSHYRPDLGNQWTVPVKHDLEGYQGDCEDFALLAASHLKKIGVPTKIAILSRGSFNRASGRLVIKRHAMLVLPDGRYVDNRHSQPFEGTGNYRVSWISPVL